MARPGLLSILETVTVQLPLAIAVTVNHTLLLSKPSPQLSAGSVPDTVRPNVVEEMVLLAQRLMALVQRSCAWRRNGSSRGSSNSKKPPNDNDGRRQAGACRLVE